MHGSGNSHSGRFLLWWGVIAAAMLLVVALLVASLPSAFTIMLVLVVATLIGLAYLATRGRPARR